MSQLISQTNRRRHENKRLDLCHFFNSCLSETFFQWARRATSQVVKSDLKHLIAYTMENIDHMLHICQFYDSETAKERGGEKRLW
jgi:hypothetical protein